MIDGSSLHITIDRMENDFAVLIFPNNQQVTVEKKYLPSDIKEGSVLHLSFYTDAQMELKQEELAKAVLNEILKNNDKENENTT